MFKKGLVVFLVLVLLGSILGVVLVKEIKMSPGSSFQVVVSPSPQTLSTQPNISLPQTLIIPKINIDTSVESVSLDSKGNMDVPKKDQNVAWYNLGPKPGEVGNVVLAGHLDTSTGSPAVFYNLNKLQIGDEIKVRDQNGKEYTYKVVDKKSYLNSQFPLQEVFGGTTRSRLNLITCEGSWNEDSQSYSNRLVVYSELTTF